MQKQQFNKINNEFVKIQNQFTLVHKQFEKVDRRFEQVDKRFEQADKRFEQVDKRFEQVDEKFERMEKRFDEKFDKFFNILMKHDNQLDNIETNMATKGEIRRIDLTLDRMVKSIDDIKQENASHLAWLKRHDKQITKLNKAVLSS